jgi:hypothetical protein
LERMSSMMALYDAACSGATVEAYVSNDFDRISIHF